MIKEKMNVENFKFYDNENNNIIKYYDLYGELKCFEELNNINLSNINGMKVKCILKNQKEIIGFADPLRLSDNTFDNSVHDYIYINTYKYLNEENNKLENEDINKKFDMIKTKINIYDISLIDVILHSNARSNARWGCKLTNKFYFIKKEKNGKDYLPDFLNK